MQTQMQSLLMQRILVTFSIAQFLILKCKLLLTGSTEDEMFSKGHYEAMLEDIYRKNYISSS